MSLLSVVTFLPQGLFIDNIAKHMEIGRRAAINQLQQTLCCGGFFFGLPTSGIMSSLLRIRQSQDFVLIKYRWFVIHFSNADRIKNWVWGLFLLSWVLQKLKNLGNE